MKNIRPRTAQQTRPCAFLWINSIYRQRVNKHQHLAQRQLKLQMQ
jgi:hypothetical protein